VDYYGTKPLTNNTDRFSYSFATGVGTNFDHAGVIRLGTGTYNFNSNSKVYFIAKADGRDTYHFSTVSPESMNIPGSVVYNPDYTYTVQLVNGSGVQDLIETLFIIETDASAHGGGTVATARGLLLTAIQSAANSPYNAWPNLDTNNNGKLDAGENGSSYTFASLKKLVDALNLPQASLPNVEAKTKAINKALYELITPTQASSALTTVNTYLTTITNYGAAGGLSVTGITLTEIDYGWVGTATATNFGGTLSGTGTITPVTQSIYAANNPYPASYVYIFSITWGKPIATEGRTVSDGPSGTWNIGGSAGQISIPYTATLIDGRTKQGNIILVG
jgi:hypothetical protein